MQNDHFSPLLLILVVTCLWLSACQPELIPSPPAVTISALTITTPGHTSATTTVPVPTKERQFTLVNLPTLVPTKTVQETPVMNAVPVSTPLEPQMQAIVTQAKADLAKQLSINANLVELIEISFVSWPDKSLGCPKPGMAYTQVMVDGLLIRLKFGGQVYEYHSGGETPPFLCK